jgi:branched-chain amino acid aminotransferase
MYSWAQRDDTTVLDEPLYAHWLRLTRIQRPYSESVFASQLDDGNAILSSLLNPTTPTTKITYLKHMAKQHLGIDKSLLTNPHCLHFLLVRSPQPVIASFAKVVHKPTLEETGYTALLDIYSHITHTTGHPPPIILSEDLAADPKGTLTALCSALHVPYKEEAMLQWPPGPKPYDGVWAEYWYQGVWKSTEFSSTVNTVKDGGNVHHHSGDSSIITSTTILPDHLKPLLEECRPLYEILRKKALRPASSIITTTNSTTTATGHHAIPMKRRKNKGGTHVYIPDDRNKDALVGIRDGISLQFNLIWRPEAKVSVLDSGFMLGDGVWEGIRLHKGTFLYLKDHLDRLYEGAKAIDMEIDVSKAQLKDMLYATVNSNNDMTDGVHVRLMITRGLKPTPYQNPNTTLGCPTIVVLAEHKTAATRPNETGIRLMTCHVRRGAPDVQDPGWNSHSKLNCIAACVQANIMGADESLMLDPLGFVATCNSTNFFVVVAGGEGSGTNMNKGDIGTSLQEEKEEDDDDIEVWAPTTKYQLGGITRKNVLTLCRQNNIPCRETDFSLTKVYSAKEAFVTGTFAGLIPVVEVDGRVIGSGKRGRVVERLQRLYMGMCDEYVAHFGSVR